MHGDRNVAGPSARDLRETRPPADAPRQLGCLQKPVGVSSQGESKLTELGVDQLAEMMDQKEMGLLRSRAAVARDDEIAGGEALGVATAAAEEGDGLELQLFRFVQGGEDVGRMTAGGEHDEEIFRAREAGDLTREGVFVAVVVDDAGEERAVGGESDSGQGAAVFGVTADEFGREMGGLRGAAAIAADEQFSATAERREDHLAGAVDLGANFGERLQGADGFGERDFEGAHGTGKESSE